MKGLTMENQTITLQSQINRFLLTGEYENAENSLKEHLNETGETKELLALMCKKFYMNDEIDNVKEYADKLLLLDEKGSEAYFFYGLLSMDSGRPAEARRYFITSLNFGYDDVLIARNIANTYIQEGNFDDALSEYDKIIENNPNNTEDRKRKIQLLLSNGLIEAANKELTELLQINPANKDMFLLKADVLSALGKNDKAVILCTTAVKFFGEDEETVSALAQALIGNNETDTANEIINEFLGKDPDSTAILLQKIRILTREKKHEEANKMLDYIAEHGKPNEKIVALYNSMQLNAFIENYDAVSKKAEELMNIEGSSMQLQEAMFYKAFAKQKLGLDAKDDYLAAIDKFKVNDEIFIGRNIFYTAMCHIQMGNTDNAKEAIEALEDIFGETNETALLKYLVNDNEPDGKEYFKKAKESKLIISKILLEDKIKLQ